MKQYKSVGLILLTLIVGFLYSCKDEVEVNPIVGVWEFSEVENGNGEDGAPDIIYSRYIKLTFNPDNTGLEEIDYIIYDQPDSYNSNFVYLTKNDILTFFYGAQPTDRPYSIDGNKLTITYLSEELVYTKIE